MVTASVWGRSPGRYEDDPLPMAAQGIDGIRMVSSIDSNRTSMYGLGQQVTP